MSIAAKTIVYAFSTQESSDELVSENVAVMSGNATYRIVVSRNVARTASEAIVSVRRECSYTPFSAAP
jgi:NMD protein affecting ribosome stability and mRNA decay